MEQCWRSQTRSHDWKHEGRKESWAKNGISPAKGNRSNGILLHRAQGIWAQIPKSRPVRQQTLGDMWLQATSQQTGPKAVQTESWLLVRHRIFRESTWQGTVDLPGSLYGPVIWDPAWLHPKPLHFVTLYIKEPWWLLLIFYQSSKNGSQTKNWVVKKKQTLLLVNLRL